MRGSGRRSLAALGAAALLAAAVGAERLSAGVQPGNEGAARAMCEIDGGSFVSNGIFGVDTSGSSVYVGYYCRFDGPAAGGTTTSADLVSGARSRARHALCDRHPGGTFYVFDRQIGPDPVADVLVSVWGCDLLAAAG